MNCDRTQVPWTICEHFTHWPNEKDLILIHPITHSNGIYFYLCFTVICIHSNLNFTLQYPHWDSGAQSWVLCPLWGLFRILSIVKIRNWIIGLVTSKSWKQESSHRRYMLLIQFLYTDQILLSFSSESSAKYTRNIFFSQSLSEIIEFNLSFFYAITVFDQFWQLLPKIYHSTKNIQLI